MKILLTGVTGYIAQRLLPVLLDHGHEVVCCVRDKNRFNDNKYCKLHSNHLIHGDYLESPNKELCYHFMKDGKYL